MNRLVSSREMLQASSDWTYEWKTVRRVRSTTRPYLSYKRKVFALAERHEKE